MPSSHRRSQRDGIVEFRRSGGVNWTIAVNVFRIFYPR